MGGLVGVIYGLFNAPKKGKEMQREAKSTIKKLVKKGKGLKRKIEPKVRKAVKKAVRIEKKAVKKGKRLVGKAKTTAKKYHATRDQAKPDKKGKKK